jgi:hypothetical protein
MHEHGNQLLKLLQLWISRGIHQDKFVQMIVRQACPRSSRGRISIRIRIPIVVGRNNDDKIADRGGISDPLIPVCCRHFFFTQTHLASLAGTISACFLTRNRPDFYASLVKLFQGLLLDAALHPPPTNPLDGWIDG